MSEIESGTLEIGEVHPACYNAYKFIKSYIAERGHGIGILIEAFASIALSGNRTGDVCGETLRRIMNNEPVSDRYILGLAWTLLEISKKDRPRKKKIENKTDKPQ